MDTPMTPEATPLTDEAAIGFARLLIDKDKSTVTELVDANFARSLERRLSAALAREAGLRKDAERYRWIRDPCSGAERVVFYKVDKEGFGNRLKSGSFLDDEIDAALSHAGQEDKP